MNWCSVVFVFGGIVALSAPVDAGAGHPAKVADRPTNIQITETGADAAGAFCGDFSLDAKGVALFFRKSRILNAKALHDRFDVLPCFVRGTAIWRDAPVRWEIRAGGTATITRADGALTLFGCRSCADEFGR